VQGTQVYVLGANGPDRIRASMFGTSAVEINTGGWPITIAPGCIELMARAFCSATYLNVIAGGGDDRIELVGSLRGFINGHCGNDVMIGDTSADVSYGGPGVDTVDYSKRIGEHITGTPGTGYDDGQPGEADNIMGDVERVVFPAA
jgi:Ca2+-binding RTX toxin-like protein